MTSDARLSQALVEQKARSIFGQRRQRFAALLEGTGDPGSVVLDGLEIAIVPTSCELDLRRQMGLRERRAGATLYLVDWHDGDILPRDLRARVAEGKLYRIGREERLRQVFHANRLSYELVLSPLARLAAAGEIEAFPKSPKLTLDLRFAVLTWLEQTLGEPFRAAAPKEADLVEACVATSPSPLVSRAEGSSDWRAWLAEVPGLIHDAISPLAGVAWHAWLQGQLHLLPAALWLLEAFEQANASDKDRKLLRAVLRQHVPGWTESVLALPVTIDGRTLDAWDALLRQGQRGAPPTQPPGLDKMIEELDSPEILAASCRLTEGRLARERALAEAIQLMLRQRGAHDPQVWDVFADRVRVLGEHRSTTEEFRTSLRMMQRLAAWLCQAAAQLEDTSSGTRRAVAIATRFAMEGGHVDWARRVMGRERPTGLLGDAWEGLRAAVEKRRDADEREFARGIQAWASAGRPPLGCIPIEQAAKTLVASFLSEATEGRPRRLLVLLMDGMSWSRCQELCDSLRRQSWEPLRWRPAGFREGPVPPVLAALPTITSVSRSAFFAGRLPPAGPEPLTSKDPDRWANNSAIRAFEGPRGLPLFMKADIEADRHMPSRTALDAISDPEQPLVAAIVNTLDDALKGAPSLEFTTQAIDIKPLRELLQRAEQAGRAVLMIADHGHVLSERTERINNSEEAGGARWRVHSDTQPLQAPETLLEKGAWSPSSTHPVILLSGERAQYGRRAHHGEHGGLSLAEVVAPAVLLGTSRLYADSADPDLDLAPPQTPSWWSEMRPSAETTPSTSAETSRAVPRPQSLFGDLGTVESEAAPPRPGRSAVTPAWVKQLRDSLAFQNAVKLAPIPSKDLDRTVEKAIAACRLLVESGGRASSRSLAQATDVALTRIDGLMSRITSILNAEGETCVRKDTATDAYIIDVARLQLVFHISLTKR